MLHRLIAFLLLCSTASAVDIVLGKAGDGSWTGSGTTFVKTWGGGVVPPDVGTPYAWWKMTGSDTNATALLDQVNSLAASNYPSVATGPALVTTNGNYYTFDMADDEFTSSSPTNFSRLKMGMSAWVWLTHYNTVAQPILSKYSFNASKAEWLLEVQRSNHPNKPASLTFFVLSNDSASYSVARGDPFPTGKWVHVSAIWNGGTNIYVYTNGINATTEITSAGVGATNQPSASAVAIGGTADKTTAWWKGGIDDVRWYYDLTPTQITNIYNAGRQ